MNKNNSFKYVVGEVVDSSSWADGRYNKDARGISVKHLYLNYVAMPVTVVTREGFRNVIATANYTDRNQFIIRTVYTLCRGPELQSFLKTYERYQPKDTDFPHLQVLINTVREKLSIERPHVNSPEPTGNIIVSVDTIISKDQLLEGDVYVVPKDLLLTLNDENTEVHHPFNTTKLVKDNYKELCKGYSGLTLFLELVDNDDSIGKRYIFAFKQMWELQPVKRPDRENGIYCGNVQLVNGRMLDPEIFKYDFDEGETALGLYRTREEAQSDGDIKSLRQEEIQRLTNEVSKRALDLQQQTQAYKLEIEAIKRNSAVEEAALKNNITNLEQALELSKKERAHEQAILEMRTITLKNEYEAKRLRENDIYEQRSNDRKESSDIIKFTSGIIAAGLAIWLAIAKSK